MCGNLEVKYEEWLEAVSIDIANCYEIFEPLHPEENGEIGN